jgi:hypothetical protein
MPDRPSRDTNDEEDEAESDESEGTDESISIGSSNGDDDGGHTDGESEAGSGRHQTFEPNQMANQAKLSSPNR